MRCRVNARTRLHGILIAVALSVAACGGGGGGGGAAPPPGSKLFVADQGNHAIASFINTNPSPGNIPVDRLITGASTNLAGNLPALALDTQRDQLYVSNEISVFVFHNASTASGNIAPNRRVASLITTANFTSLYMDAQGDILYVGDASNGVKVYTSASTLNELGGGPTSVPTRTITGDFGTSGFIRGVAVDRAKDILYVAAITPTPAIVISVFANQSGLTTGSYAPDRVITIAATSGMGGMFLDTANDRLYVSNNGGSVLVFDSVSTKFDPTAPERTIDLGVPVTPKLAVDVVNKRLFAAADVSGLYIVHGADTLNGSDPNELAAAPPGGNLSGIAVTP
jgi:hypothetical protein